ncbi:metacaspase 1 [Plasmodium gonderi]|uniref:Metacaspase 1 n=1 Tax=Plasmodium gonderi TaxID=77519 RepID=A0A1Y1JGR3_PLAGO|nr:metacaspase 1 [Plasmodium gonderi]GAW81706.1 metacaspase 1 [Plasmodium gonderi]
MDKIYLKVFELSGLQEDDCGSYYIKIYWKNKKYKTSIQRDGYYFFNDDFLIPVENLEKEKKEMLSIEVWMVGILNKKIAYTFFTLEFIEKERTLRQKVQLIDIIKKCTVELSLNLVRTQMDITFFNVKEIYQHKTDQEIRNIILIHRNQDEVVKILRNSHTQLPTHSKEWPEQNVSSVPQYTHTAHESEMQNRHYHYNTGNHRNELSHVSNNIPFSTSNQLNNPANVINNTPSHSVNMKIDTNNCDIKYIKNSFPNPSILPNLYDDNNQRNQNYYQSNLYNIGSASPYSDKILHCSSRNKKKALLIGINYYGSSEELNGCTNDTVRMKNLLISKYNFYDSSTNMVRLIDNEINPIYRPTRKNILSALTWLTKDNQAGDVFFFLYSGHGSQQKDYTCIEDDGYNETILPCDHKTQGQIIDDELHKYLVQPLNDGVKLIAVMDCCNAGSCIDLAYKYKMKCRKWKEVKNPFHVVCDVSQFSGCKDMEFSHEIETGTHAPGGSLVTAMIHVLTTSVDSYKTGNIVPYSNALTYDHLLQNVSDYIKSYHNQKIVFMASQKFSIDQRVFDFEHILKNKNDNLGQNINKLVKKKKKKKNKDYFKRDFFSFF